MNPIIVALGTLLMMASIYSGVLRIQVGELTDDIVQLELAIRTAEMNNKQLSGAIDSQNKLIETISIDLSRKETELNEWKSKPEKVRYENIYKFIPKEIDTRRTDCETTQQTIDAVRNINFNAI